VEAGVSYHLAGQRQRGRLRPTHGVPTPPSERHLEEPPYGDLRRHSGSMRGYVAGGQPASGLPPNQLPPIAREPMLSPIACVLAPMLATELALESFHYEVLRPPPL
jgi:hypothetical protein